MKSILVPVVALFLALPIGARAGDLCLDAAGGAAPTFEKPVIIGRGFRLPARNQCKPFIGVLAVHSLPLPTSVTGSACTAYDGSGVSFTLVATVPPRRVGSSIVGGIDMLYSATLAPQGSSAGNGYLTAFETSSSATTTITAYECRNAYPDNL